MILTRECITCLERKPLTTEYFYRNGSSTLYSRCKPCELERQKWKQLYKLYGVDKETYFKMLSEQGGTCKICKTNSPGAGADNRKNFCIDHDHTTGKIRGLLCVSCNIILGHVKDDPDHLVKLIAYLEEYTQ